MGFGTLIVLAALAGAVALVIRSMVRRRRQGRSCCGDCSKCDGCH